MSNSLKNALSFLAVAVIAAVLVIYIGDLLGAKSDFKKLQKEVLAKEAEQQKYKDSLLWEIKERDIKIKALGERAAKHDSLQKKHLQDSRHFRAKYERLIEEGYPLAETAQDSLEVCLNASGALFGEVQLLRKAITEANLALHNLKAENSLLDQQVIDYQKALEAERRTTEMWRAHAKQMSDFMVKEKQKSFWKGIGIGAGAVVGLSYAAQSF